MKGGKARQGGRGRDARIGLRGFQRAHLVEPAAEQIALQLQIVAGLEIHPELRRGAEVAPEAQCGIRRNAALAEHNLVDAPRRDADIGRKPVLRDAERLQKFLAQDFTTATTLISRLQEEGLLLSSMAFSLTEKARRDAEDSVTQQAIKSWEERAQRAAQGLGFSAWAPGHIVVQTSDQGRVYPVMRAQAMAAAPAPPVATEAGTTEVTVTVTGDAVLGIRGR